MGLVSGHALPPYWVKPCHTVCNNRRAYRDDGGRGVAMVFPWASDAKRRSLLQCKEREAISERAVDSHMLTTIACLCQSIHDPKWHFHTYI